MSDVSVQKLMDFSLFKGLSEYELGRISKIVKTGEKEAGATIVSEKDPGNELYLLEEGVVDILKTLTIVTSRNEFGSKERSFIRLTGENHAFFGEMVLFGKKERSATVKAVTKCRLFIIRENDFLSLCEQEPRIGYIVLTNIALILSDHLRRANEDIIKLTTALSLALSG
jgi:CRP/FNR family transcriptional regulator, cyclic AMP receptor protein